MHGTISHRTLLVGRDPELVDGLVAQLRSEGLDVVGVATDEEALARLADGGFALVVLGGGLDDARRQGLMATLRQAEPQVPVYCKDRQSGPEATLEFVRMLARGQGWRHTLEVSRFTGEDHDFVELAPFNNGSVGVFRCGPRTSPWEHHPDDDEVLYVLSGEVVLTLLTDAGPIAETVGPGQIFVVPRGLWHRHHVADHLVEFYATPGGTVHSDAVDPREG